MFRITVVIGDRLGKGQKVAAGIEKAGGKAIVVPGVAADMKLGDVMKAENADFGISFAAAAVPGPLRLRTNMVTRRNTVCGPSRKALPPLMKGLPCSASALWIKKSWVNACYRRGTRSKADERTIRHHGEGQWQRRQ